MSAFPLTYKGLGHSFGVCTDVCIICGCTRAQVDDNLVGECPGLEAMEGRILLIERQSHLFDVATERCIKCGAAVHHIENGLITGPCPSYLIASDEPEKPIHDMRLDDYKRAFERLRGKI